MHALRPLQRSCELRSRTARRLQHDVAGVCGAGTSPPRAGCWPPGAASGRLSTTQTQVMAAALCARGARPLTEDERRRFMPDGACFNPDAAAPLQALITARGPARGLARHHSAAPSDLRNRVVCTLSAGQRSSSNANAYPRGVQ
jgi:hypothetical protein